MKNLCNYDEYEDVYYTDCFKEIEAEETYDWWKYCPNCGKEIKWVKRDVFVIKVKGDSYE